jgi:hypothetical protein
LSEERQEEDILAPSLPVGRECGGREGVGGVRAYRRSASVDSADGLAVYCSREPKVRYAYLVTREDRDFGVTELAGVTAKFLKIPAHIFIYLLGQAEHSLWKQAGRKTNSPPEEEEIVED